MLGISERVAAIVPVEMGVLDLQSDPEALAERVANVCCTLHETERIGAVCLGCTAMHCMIDILRKKLQARNCPIMVIEPLRNGLRYCEHIISMGYRNGLHVLKSVTLPKGYENG